MLKLLSIHNAAMFVHCQFKNINLSFDPEVFVNIKKDEKEYNYYLMCRAFIENAVFSEELPSLKKAKGKAADKKQTGWSTSASNHYMLWCFQSKP